VMLEAQMAAKPRWLRGTEGVTYPPEPWFLGGALTGSVFLVPRRALPAEHARTVPADHHLVSVAGLVPLAVSFVHYLAGGVLSYDELLVALPVRRRATVRFSIAQIWVDSASSAQGGRALWAIPKQLAEFARASTGAVVQCRAAVAGKFVASLTATQRRTLLPGRWQFPLTTAQALEGREVIAGNSIVGRPHLTTAAWEFAADGPLGWLAAARPLFGLSIDEAAIAFGQRVARR
jgi:hypothetical protein